MRRMSIVLALVMALGVVAGPAPAKKGGAKAPSLPKLTGGGQAENDNTGGAPAEQVTQFGFEARATSEGVDGAHSFFGTPVTVYEATGEFQARNYDANDKSNTLSEGHGDVVCIANFGPSSGVDGGGNEDGDVWEIRVAFDHPDFGTVYGSFLVQDNGKDDYLDENFSGSRIFSPDCGDAEFFQLEEVTKGQIKVH